VEYSHPNTPAYTDPVYGIGMAASRLGLNVHSLRQYEAEGLIIPFKTLSGRRFYSELELEKVRCIKSMLQEKRLNFEGIRQLLALVPCWKLKGCPAAVRDTCKVRASRSGPCWQNGGACSSGPQDCRTCQVYRRLSSCDDLKQLLYEN
jgi:MerR family transcriptional regulator/heat shock protein HspR